MIGGSLIIQQFTGGTVSLYDPSQTLLLSGNLSNSALSGTAGLADGGLFTTTFSTPLDGTLAPYVNPGTLVLQMHLFNINGGRGLAAGPTAPPNGGELYSFTAIVIANIDGEPFPEPATATDLLIILGTCRSLQLRVWDRGGRSCCPMSNAVLNEFDRVAVSRGRRKAGWAGGKALGIRR